MTIERMPQAQRLLLASAHHDMQGLHAHDLEMRCYENVRYQQAHKRILCTGPWEALQAKQQPSKPFCEGPTIERGNGRDLTFCW